MINQQLLDYVRAQLRAGVRKEDVIKMLANGGWTPQDATEAFMAIEGVQTPPAPPKTPLAPPQPLSTSVSSAMTTAPSITAPTAQSGGGFPINYTSASFGQPVAAPVVAKKKGKGLTLFLTTIVILVFFLGAGFYALIQFPGLISYLPAPLQEMLTPATPAQ